MEEKVITYIEAAHIRPHPENPRKNLGDLSELVESIKKNGVLQNLTVIPVEGEPGEYMTLIGHRRYAAGTQAGIEKFPCQIAENLTPREQVSIMLEENMQRAPSESIPIKVFGWLSALIYEAVSNPITVSDAKNG